MALAIDDLIEPLTADQVEVTLLDALTLLGVNATNWRPKGVLRRLLRVSATVIAGVTTLVASAIRGTILEYSTGVWLTALAVYVYGVERIKQTFATGFVTLTNAGGGVYGYDAEEVLFLNSTSGKTYTNTARIDLGAFETLEGVPVRAVEAGSTSNAANGEIDDFVTPLLGVTVTNEAALIGTDEQDDASLRQDCADARGRLSPFGPTASYAYFAKRTVAGAPLARADGTAIGVNRVQVEPVAFGGAINVFVLTPSGELDSDDLDIVEANLREWALPPTATLNLYNADPVAWAVRFNVSADAALVSDAAALKQRITDRILAFYSVYPIGGVTIDGSTYHVFLDQLRGVILATDPGIITATLVTPTVNGDLDVGEYAAATVSNLSTVTLVAQ